MWKDITERESKSKGSTGLDRKSYVIFIYIIY